MTKKPIELPVKLAKIIGLNTDYISHLMRLVRKTHYDMTMGSSPSSFSFSNSGEILQKIKLSE